LCEIVIYKIKIIKVSLLLYINNNFPP